MRSWGLVSIDSAVVAIGVSDVSLTLTLVGAIVLAGATVIMTAVPSFRFPRWFRRRPAGPTEVVPVPTQRRVVTGKAATLPPITAPLAGQQRSPTDGRRPTSADVSRAEAVIDRYLEADPELLAATLSSWLAADDRTRSAHP